MKILCVEDDKGLAALLQRSLVKQHYQVELAGDGQLAWDLAETNTYDLILLDWNLPKLTGIELCQRLRTEPHSALNPNRDTPILLMTGLDAVTNKVMGLNAGADDYVVKPFDLDELLARIRALLRRSRGARSPLLQWGNLCLNPNSCEVTYQEQPVLLAAKEYELLELLLRNPDQIFSINRLLVALWAVEEMPSEGAVRSHIKGLRQKLKQAGADDPIETIYKLGYRLRQRKTAAPIKSNPEREIKIKTDVADVADVADVDQTDTADTADTADPKKTANSAGSPISQEFLDVWQECRQSYCDRLSIIEQSVTALQKGTLTAKQQQQAEREAHTLIGSLGSFGLAEASKISRQIQQILKQQQPLKTGEIEQLTHLIARLRLDLEDVSQEKLKSVNTLKLTPSTALEPSLLIVDDDWPLTQLLAKEALSWGFQAQVATDLETAQKVLMNGAISVILLDLNSSNSANSLDFLATTHCQYPDVPVVILTAEKNFEKRVEAARLGSRCFLQKPIAPAEVLAAVTQVLQQTSRLTARILIVDDDLELLKLLGSLLKSCNYQVTLLNDPQQFWQVLEQTVPDLLILDIELCEPTQSQHSPDQTTTPTLSGIELCQVIRSDLQWNRLPVLFLSAHTDVKTIQRSFSVGADDFLNKPVVVQELLTRVRTRLEQRNLWKTVDLDELTGVSLRRKAQQDLTRLIQLAQRQQQPFSLAVLDLDYFKQVNDQYGHDVGDQVLSYLGKLLQQSVRQADVVGRWGGEEFTIGMYGMTKQDGINRLKEMLNQLNQYVFLAPDGSSFQVTFSAGIAQLPVDGNELQKLYHCADQALYQAKAAGRNRIFAAESLESLESFDPLETGILPTSDANHRQ